MSHDGKIFQETADAFRITDEELFIISENFREEISRGLRPQGVSSLKLLPSYLSAPKRSERGDFIALDFGGTNARASLVKLFGDGRFEIASRASMPLAVPEKYDHLSEDSSAEALFDFLAALIEKAAGAQKGSPMRLGHTFSFPSEQDSLKDAKLIRWTKEAAVPGVEGRMVNELLSAALSRRGLFEITPAAILNDTVAALIAAAYQKDNVFIGSIYATGHNTAYLEESLDMVLNMESGNFSKFPANRFDDALDAASENPGEQRLEKSVSGKYLGELFSRAVSEASGKNISPVSGAELSAIISGEAAGKRIISEIIGEDAGEGAAMIASSVVRRSARLVAATLAGTMRHIASDKGRVTPQSVAVEGTLFSKSPLIQNELCAALKVLLGEDSDKIEIFNVTDGATLGAALAAAMA